MSHRKPVFNQAVDVLNRSMCVVPPGAQSEATPITHIQRDQQKGMGNNRDIKTQIHSTGCDN